MTRTGFCYHDSRRERRMSRAGAVLQVFVSLVMFAVVAGMLWVWLVVTA